MQFLGWVFSFLLIYLKHIICERFFTENGFTHQSMGCMEVNNTLNLLKIVEEKDMKQRERTSVGCVKIFRCNGQFSLPVLIMSMVNRHPCFWFCKL